MSSVTARPTPWLSRALGTTATVATLVVVGACSGGADGAGDASTVPTSTPRSSVSQDQLATTQDASPSSRTCTVGDREPAAPTGSWEHPSQSFYTGEEDDLPAATDLEHLLRADGAAVVRYRADALPRASMDALRTWAEDGVAVIALPADDAAQSPLVVDTVDLTLSCDGLDTVRLDSFLAERDFGDVEAH